MSALLGMSLWVVLATVVPGLITVAVLFLCFNAAGMGWAPVDNDWVMAGVALTAMVLTQAVGVLLEELLVRFHLLGPNKQAVQAPDPGRPGEFMEVQVKPYEQYSALYVVLAQVGEHEDSQGHLKRALAQFFLTNNTLVSFAAGVVVASALLILGRQVPSWFVAGLLVALGLSYYVARIRFREMTRSLWAVQHYRSAHAKDRESN